MSNVWVNQSFSQFFIHRNKWVRIWIIQVNPYPVRANNNTNIVVSIPYAFFLRNTNIALCSSCKKPFIVSKIAYHNSILYTIRKVHMKPKYGADRCYASLDIIMFVLRRAETNDVLVISLKEKVLLKTWCFYIKTSIQVGLIWGV